MTISYVLAPEPFWILINNNGTAAGGAKLYTKSSLNIDQDKPVYTDDTGVNAYTNPILFGLNGVAPGPFYFKVDTANPDDLYFLRAEDAQDDLLWTIEDFNPGATGGGGGNTTTYLPINNYIANNQFIDHIDDIAGPSNLTNTVIAPSNHKGFTPSLINPVIATFGAVGPDIRFVKNNTSIASDSITFPLFPLASAPITVTPVEYVRYVCTGTPAGETYKSFQFPITQKIKNLSNQQMTFNIWAAVTATPATVKVYVRQYLGSSPSATSPGDFRTQVGSFNLTTTWQQFPTTITIPNVNTKSIGTPGAQTDDDALYIQFEMPLGSACDILFTKPTLYLGAINPNFEFEDYDQINSVNSTPRTGDIRTSLSSAAPQGWVAMNDESIGNVSSGATSRANKDTFQLYKTIWDGVIDTWAPVSTGRGASAIADFLANKTLTLPKSLGRALAGAGTGSGLTARVLGQNAGAETVVLTGANLPAGAPFNSSFTTDTTVSGGAISVFHVPTSTVAYTAGSGTGASIVQPTSFFNIFIKL